MLDTTKMITFQHYLQGSINKPAAAMRVLRTFVEEVSIMHDMGLSHGDLTIGNIFVTDHDHNVRIFLLEITFLCVKYSKNYSVQVTLIMFQSAL